ncbi:MAG: ECF transporter S component [Firmicutes bacterium]|nr:ECF transporter S component [Bacillota bacterium]
MNRLMLKKLCVAAVLLAACTLMTAFLSVPTFITGIGNINLGDCVTFAACMLLGLWYAPAVGALGGMLADLLSGYAVYAPVTFVAKGVMALLMCLMIKRRNSFARCVIGVLLGGAAMVGCYFVYELILYGFAVAGANVLFNAVQVAVNGALALAVYPVIKKAAPILK